MVDLSPHHLAMLHASAISDEVIAARGYRTITDPSDPALADFGDFQRQTPGLLLPLWAPDGSTPLNVYRPDVARVKERRDKPRLPDGTYRQDVTKYEFPAGADMRIDCPPTCRASLGDPRSTLWVVEGQKKADALASHGQTAVAILGVWNWRGRNDKGGKVALPDLDLIAFNERSVFIAFDSDAATNPNVINARKRLTALLRQRGARVSWVYLPNGPDGAKWGIDDYLGAGHTIAEAFALVGAPEDAGPVVPPDRSKAGRPSIILGCDQLRDETAAALAALVEANRETIFVRGGGLVRIRRDEHGQPMIDPINEAIMRSLLANAADFFRLGQEGPRAQYPPEAVCRDLLALGTWPFPPLDAVIEAPCLRPDGSILSCPGYDPATHLFYLPQPGFTMPEIAERPQWPEIKAALKALEDIFGDFPWQNRACEANAIGLALTPIVRPMTPTVPLALIDAPEAGTGKSLLASVIALISTGRPAAMFNLPRGDDEVRKTITSALSGGATFITFDNIEGHLNAPALALALTAETWVDRILGKSESVRLRQSATWLVTGNNIMPGGDLPRRCYLIRLDAKTPRPWQGRSFRHPDLLGYVAEHRGALLAALLTLVRAWCAHDRLETPEMGTPITLGSFESWSRIVGGVLRYAGVKEFLTNLDELYDRADDEALQWADFLKAWGRWRSDPVSAADLADSILLARQDGKAEVPASIEEKALYSALPDYLQERITARDGGSFRRSLGRALSKQAERRFGDGIHFKRSASDSDKGRPRWVVVNGAQA